MNNLHAAGGDRDDDPTPDQIADAILGRETDPYASTPVVQETGDYESAQLRWGAQGYTVNEDAVAVCADLDRVTEAADSARRALDTLDRAELRADEEAAEHARLLSVVAGHRAQRVVDGEVGHAWYAVDLDESSVRLADAQAVYIAAVDHALSAGRTLDAALRSPAAQVKIGTARTESQTTWITSVEDAYDSLIGALSKAPANVTALRDAIESALLTSSLSTHSGPDRYIRDARARIQSAYAQFIGVTGAPVVGYVISAGASGQVNRWAYVDKRTDGRALVPAFVFEAADLGGISAALGKDHAVIDVVASASPAILEEFDTANRLAALSGMHGRLFLVASLKPEDV